MGNGRSDSVSATAAAGIMLIEALGSMCLSSFLTILKRMTYNTKGAAIGIVLFTAAVVMIHYMM